MARTPPRIGLYGDVDLNLIDGSAIWLQAVAQAFSRADCDVTVLLKAPVKTTRLTAPLEATPRIRLVRPFEEHLLEGLANALSPHQATVLLSRLDAEQRFDVVVIRGYRLVKQVVAEDALRGRLWTYLTDIPHSVYDMDSDDVAQLTAIADASQCLLCQTEELRSFLDGMVPAAVDKTVLFPPIIPDLGDIAVRDAVQQPIKLVYSGKFAPNWNTLQMTRLPAGLAARGVRAQLHMVGDKIHRDATVPTFFDAMSAALHNSEGLIWHGGKPREEAMAIAAGCDVGLSWRDSALDASLELSTKILEFGAYGVPVILNPTPPHAALLGYDYPLFAQTEQDVLDAVVTLVEDPARYAMASARCIAAAEGFTVARAADRIQTYLRRALPTARAIPGRAEPLKVVVASHDLKFFTRILDYLQTVPALEVRVDEWAALAQHDESQSAELRDWADVIVCEWCGPNTIWYSRHKRPDQRLITRLHRFELYTHYPTEVAIDNVDHVVCVSPHYADVTRTITGWPAEKIVTIPNWVDVLTLNRPKYAGAPFHLGMIGIAPARKRLDLAIDVIEELRRSDERFVLFAKTKMPWQYWWIWNKEEEREHYRAIFRRIQTTPLLRRGVVFDDFGPDVAAWLQKIGWVLSTSDDESFHLSPAEGMASGAVPALLPWPGSDTIYSDRWIHDSPAAIAETIRHAASDGWSALAGAATREVDERYRLETVCGQWFEVVADLRQADQRGAL